jgi:hypothetical protein
LDPLGSAVCRKEGQRGHIHGVDIIPLVTLDPEMVRGDVPVDVEIGEQALPALSL